jgi:signal transduction histidine kinase
MGQSIAEIAERRASTDACLEAERATSTIDDHVRATSARRMLDDLIERDRIIADTKLSKFRDGADRALSRERSDASAVSPGISDERDSADHQVEVERDMADATLLRERKRSDAAVDVERQEHDALRVDMETMRHATDDRLSSERQGADSTSDALGQTRTALILAQSGKGRANEVLAMVSHDLRSPLSVISLNTESIVEKTQEPATRAAANTVMQGISRMERLLYDLLDMARIESGTLNIVRRQHDIGALLREVLQIYEPMFVSRDITFTVDIPPQSVEAFFDHDRIVQVLSNLLGNAMKFTPGGGVVALRAERQAKHVAFALHNDGAGISPSALPHIFERFWQLDSNERRGLGLGLSICRAIVTAHGGQIWAESEVGRGAMFRFTLPVR